MLIIQKLKLWLVALGAFVAALVTAEYYRRKSYRLNKKVKQEKAKIHNYEKQLEAANRKKQMFEEEINDALKNDDYLNYFDDDPWV